MKTTSLALTLAAAAALMVPAARDVQAAYTGIQRCEMPDGSRLYTDKPCAQFNARPSAMSSELGMRLASEQSREAELRMLAGVDDLQALSSDPMLASSAGTPAGRRSVAAGCARTPTQLAMDLQGSIALHDVNRLAESYHWVGMSHAQAKPLLQRLDRMAQQQVVATQYYSASMGLGLDLADAGGWGDGGDAGTMLVQLHGDGSTQALELNVHRYAGCYFLRF